MVEILPIFLLGACEYRAPTILSPTHGAVVTVPWIPLSARLPPLGEAKQPQVLLDGQPFDDPNAVVTWRQAKHGGSSDYLAALDTAHMAEGEHELQMSLGWGRSSTVTFTIDHPDHKVDIAVVGEDGTPLSARVIIRSHDTPVSFAAPDIKAVDRKGRDLRLDSVFADDGATSVWLAPGSYEFIAVRGVRYDIDMQHMEVDGDLDIRLVVPRIIDTPGVVTADLHVHTARSYDSFLPDKMRYRSLQCADIDAFVTTDHNVIATPPQGMAQTPSTTPKLVIQGIEADLKRDSDNGEAHEGHVNVFPLSVGQELPTRKPEGLAHLIDLYRARQEKAPHPLTGTELVFQLNHPRGLQFKPGRKVFPMGWALFNHRDFNPRAPLDHPDNRWLTERRSSGTRGADIDAIEVMNRFSQSLYEQVRRDWFALLNHGLRITGTGNSDSHALTSEVAGFPVNLVEASMTKDGPDLEDLVASVRGGRVGVSSGPVVELSIIGAGAGVVFEPGDTFEGTEALARVRVRAAPWVPMSEARLVVGGEVVHRVELSPDTAQPLDVTFEIPLTLSGNTWVLAEAGWPLDEPYETQGIYGLIAPGYTPTGFTNPVYVEHQPALQAE